MNHLDHLVVKHWILCFEGGELWQSTLKSWRVIVATLPQSWLTTWPKFRMAKWFCQMSVKEPSNSPWNSWKIIYIPETKREWRFVMWRQWEESTPALKWLVGCEWQLTWWRTGSTRGYYASPPVTRLQKKSSIQSPWFLWPWIWICFGPWMQGWGISENTCWSRTIIPRFSWRKNTSTSASLSSSLIHKNCFSMMMISALSRWRKPYLLRTWFSSLKRDGRGWSTFQVYSLLAEDDSGDNWRRYGNIHHSWKNHQSKLC